MNLREYQERQLGAIEDAYLHGVRQQVVSAATGTGAPQVHVPPTPKPALTANYLRNNVRAKSVNGWTIASLTEDLNPIASQN